MAFLFDMEALISHWLPSPQYFSCSAAPSLPQPPPPLASYSEMSRLQGKRERGAVRKEPIHGWSEEPGLQSLLLSPTLQRPWTSVRSHTSWGQSCTLISALVSVHISILNSTKYHRPCFTYAFPRLAWPWLLPYSAFPLSRV